MGREGTIPSGTIPLLPQESRTSRVPSLSLPIAIPSRNSFPTALVPYFEPLGTEDG